MTEKHILVSDSLDPEGINILDSGGKVTYDPKITPEMLVQAIGEFDALVVRSRTKVTPGVIAAGKRLKVIGRAGVGVDNIDLAAAKSQGVLVVNSPLAASVAVAEHTLGLMLALARLIPTANESMKSGKWEKSAFKGGELYGSTLGILGLGRIGARVAELAAAFGMKVCAYDPFLDAGQIRERNALPATFEQVLAESDFISLHLPLTPESRGLLGKEQFGQVKNGVRLVCTARGGVIDEAALLEALDSGRVAGAGLDVFAVEPPPLNGLLAHPNVVATPHIAAQTHAAQKRAGTDIASEVLAALQNRPLRWRVV